ncbi:MAG TPA: hypothetical protein VM141_06220 [Planctomycetota bacterium]|nr:hypothetical protein [Planctomycetota bacterium]
MHLILPRLGFGGFDEGDVFLGRRKANQLRDLLAVFSVFAFVISHLRVMDFDALAIPIISARTAGSFSFRLPIPPACRASGGKVENNIEPKG